MVSLSNNNSNNINITTKNGIGVNLTSNNDTDVNANMNGNAQRAKSWAVGEGLIDGVDYSAKYYAQDAKESAEQASGGVEAITEAKEQALSAIDTEKTEAIADMETAKEEKISEIEDTAADFEDDLEALTTRAETAATNAETSETNAATSATSAGTSATNASISATSASTSATNASNSATSAATNANLALGYKNDAYTYKEAAASAASDAGTYKTQASNSATSASQSATSAAQAQTAAENARDAAEGYAEQAEAAKDDIEAELDNYVPNTRKINNKPLSTDITLTASDIGALANTTKYGYSIALSLDTTNYKLTLTLKDQDGTALSTKTVDFPIESVVVNGSYDSTNKKIVLTLQSGSTIDIPVGDLISGLQSEITSTNKLDSDLVDDTNNSHKFATAAQLNQIATNTSSISNLATVATSGDYDDLTNKPTIPTVNNAKLTIQKNGTTVKTFTANASSNVTCNITVPTAVTDLSDANNYVLSSSLASVATSGSYNDLSNKPTIPTDTNDLTNGAGYITGITSTDVTNALGYTPYNSTNPNGYTSNIGTVTKVNNTSPDSSGNVSITIPTVPTNVSAFTNDSGYITSSALSPYALSSSLATVATSGSYNDLSNKPTIPDAQVQADWDVTDTTSKAYIKNKPTIPSGVVVDQTYDGTSANAQSGVAIAGAGFLKNEATQSGSSIILQGLTKNRPYAIGIGVNNSATDYCTVVGATATTTGNYSTSIGYYARTSSTYATALGNGTYANAQYSLAVGSGATTSQTNAMAVGTGSLASGTRATALGSGATASGNYAIQIGYGTNNTANTLNVGFWNATNTHYNWQLLDGTTGLIPDARISTNIARTSAIPDISTKQDTLVSGTNIKTINNESLLGSGDISVLQNAATGTNALTLLGTETSSTRAINIGYNSSVSNSALSTALGSNAKVQTADGAIQIGGGTNSTSNTLSIGFYNAGTNYRLLDGTTGLIPDARISDNIARTSDVAVTDLSNLSARGKEVIDGQWVSVNQAIISSATSLNGSSNLTYRVDLPNDEHKYEVMIKGVGYTNSTAGNEIWLTITGNEDSQSRYIGRARAAQAGTFVCCGTVICTMSYVASNAKNLTLARDTTWKGSCSELKVIAYRRIGTNT